MRALQRALPPIYTAVLAPAALGTDPDRHHPRHRILDALRLDAKRNLAKGLSVVGKAVSTRSTLPVLGNVLLATENSRLKLAATNLELGITCWIGARVEDDVVKGAVEALEFGAVELPF